MRACVGEEGRPVVSVSPSSTATTAVNSTHMNIIRVDFFLTKYQNIDTFTAVLIFARVARQTDNHVPR